MKIIIETSQEEIVNGLSINQIESIKKTLENLYPNTPIEIKIIKLI